MTATVWTSESYDKNDVTDTKAETLCGGWDGGSERIG